MQEPASEPNESVMLNVPKYQRTTARPRMTKANMMRRDLKYKLLSNKEGCSSCVVTPAIANTFCFFRTNTMPIASNVNVNMIKPHSESVGISLISKYCFRAGPDVEPYKVQYPVLSIYASGPEGVVTRTVTLAPGRTQGVTQSSRTILAE